MNNNDIRKNIWSYLRYIPEPLNTTAKIIYKKDDNPLFGDIYLDEINKVFYIYNKKNKFIKISNDTNIIIPIEVTQYIINSTDYFSNMLFNENLIINLRNDDTFIINNFGDLPDYWDYSFVNTNNLNYLRVAFNSFIIKDFLYYKYSKEDIFTYYNKSMMKRTKFYLHISKDDLLNKMSISNYENEYNYNFFEFYVNKVYYDKTIIINWIDKILNSDIIPIYWDIKLIKFFSYPMYICIEFKGPLCERSELIKKIKYEYNILENLNSKRFTI